VKKLRRTKTLRQAITVILGIAALALPRSSSSSSPSPPTPQDAEVRPHLEHGLSITSTISSSPRTRSLPCLPRIQRYLWYTAHNRSSPHHGDLHKHRGCDATGGCRHPTSTTAKHVHRLARGPAIGTNAVSVAHRFFETHTNQTRVRTRPSTSPMRHATYTESMPRHGSHVLAGPVGCHTRATVTASAAATGPVPSSPTGTVTFTDGTTTFCTVHAPPTRLLRRRRPVGRSPPALSRRVHEQQRQLHRQLGRGHDDRARVLDQACP